MTNTQLPNHLIIATQQKAFDEIYNILNSAALVEKGELLECYLEYLYKGNGWLVKRNAGRNDKGADLLLYHPESPDKPTFIIQAKNHKSPLTFDDTKIELIKFEDQASLKYNCHNYELISLNGYVENARGLNVRALADFNMALFDFEKIKTLVSNYQEGNVTPSLELAAHNLQTSIKVRQQFIESQRVAVVQATGTGKSYIVGQALIDAMPHACIFLAPSHFILANQKKLLPWRDNVTYMTYAKAANATKEEWLAINPQLIVLDEFHRAGADVWGEGVQRLMQTCPNAKVLGTSATPIRFLDNQRNMVDELFEGSVANEITLHDAIAKAILPNPLYVSGLYSLDETLVEYEQAIETCKATAEQKAQNLDDLKKIKIDWEQSSGIPQILDKHLEKLAGKYIVFCEDIDHLDEMQEEVSRWFRLAGKQRKEMLTRTNYLVHSANTDAQNNEQLAAFENANADKAVHILLSVNMLNEGLHIRHVNSVILLRKTTSPIIYLQQLGRCLQVGGGIKPVVFDLVSNINNLGAHSFQTGLNEALEKENAKREKVGLAATKLKLDIHDETLEITHQLERIENELGLNLSSFVFWYGLLEEFVRENGHCRVNFEYKSTDGYKLGQWVSVKRKYRNSMLAEYKANLDTLGFVWDALSDKWCIGFQHLQEFVDQYGNCNVALRFNALDGYKLGSWVSYQRANKDKLLPEYIEKLDSLGFVWDVLSDKWEIGFQYLQMFAREYGNCKVKASYESIDGYNLGVWVSTQRANKNMLLPEYIERLDSLGFVWDALSDKWEIGFQYLKEFVNKQGHCKVSGKFKSDDGFDLGTWVGTQRTNRDTLLLEYKDQLNALGFIWNPFSEKWEIGYEHLREFVNKHGHCKVNAIYETVDGYNLGFWVVNQRKKKNTMLPEYKARLNELGFVWDVFQQKWEIGFQHLQEFQKVNGHCCVLGKFKCSDGYSLGTWVANQRIKKNVLLQDSKEKLDSLGFVWEVK